MEFVADKLGIRRVEKLFQLQKAQSLGFRAENVSERKKRLSSLLKWILANRERATQAIHKDFRKPHLEVETTELYPVVAEIRHVLDHLDQWVKPKKVDAPFSYLGTRSSIHFEPKGVCLILAPWNFPFNLCIGPLVSCLAAGNTAVLKIGRAHV